MSVNFASSESSDCHRIRLMFLQCSCESGGSARSYGHAPTGGPTVMGAMTCSTICG